jgi:hypothetical protein
MKNSPFSILVRRYAMFELTFEPTNVLWQPAPPLPTHAPNDALVPVVHFIPASAHQFIVHPEDFADCEEIRQGIVRFSTCKLPNTASLSVEVNLSVDGQQTLGSIIVQTPSSLLLTRVQFPIQICPEVQPVDHLLSAYSWGDDILDPIYQIPRYCARVRSRTPLTFIDHGENELIYVYPAAMSMQFMTLYNANRSIYLACYSEGDETISLNARVGAENALHLSVNHYPFVSGREWRSPECATAHLAGGWLPAAGLYAGRMRARMPQAQHSPWLQYSFDGWAEVGLHFEGKAPEYHYNDLPDIFRSIQADGIRTLHIYGWSGNGHDTLYPDYDIDPALGSAEDLRRALDKIKAWGGRAMLYTNSRLVDPASRFYRSGGSAFVCRQRDGSPYLENYGTSVSFAVACPACAGYRDYFTGQVRRMVAEFGAHAIQMDQINSTIGFLCFDPAHREEHRSPAANFLPGWSELARQVEAAGRELEPDFFMWGEGCQERFGRHIAVHQGHGEARTVTVGAMQPALFRYVYPGAIVTGIANSLDQLARAAAQGKPLDLWRPSKLAPEVRLLMRAYINLRQAHPDYYFEGRFTAGAGLETAGPVEAFGIQGAGGELLVSLWAPGAAAGQRVEAWLRQPRPGHAARALFPPDLIIAGEEWLRLGWNGPLAVVEFA